MVKHIDLNKIAPIDAIHFERWLMLWRRTVTENFKGRKADEAISRAASIAGVMKFKIEQSAG